jgi:hypothetical protein
MNDREIIIPKENREDYFNKNTPFHTRLHEYGKCQCCHCWKVINPFEYKVFVDAEDGDFESICCPNAPECDGTLIDWVPLKRG